MAFECELVAWSFGKGKAESTNSLAKIPVQSVSKAPLPAMLLPVETKVVHRVLKDKDCENFLIKVGLQARLDTEMVLVSQMVEDKRVELVRLDQEMERKYGVISSQSYSFDMATRTLFMNRVQLEDGGEGTNNLVAGNSQATRTVFKVFPDASEAKQFLKTAAGRARMAGMTESLAFVLLEKQEQYQALRAELKDQFGIDPEKRYSFDKASKTIYVKDVSSK